MKTFGIIAAGVLISIAAMADTVTSTGTFVSVPGNFQSTTGTSNVPFWNNWSVDGNHMNAGDILTGNSGSAGSTNYLGSNASYLSTGGSGPDAPNFSFLQSAVTDQATLLFSEPISNYPYAGVTVTEIGLYDVADLSQNVALYSGAALYNSSDPHGIVNNSVTPQTPVTMNTWANYGIFANVCGYNADGSSYCNTYYSDSALNQASDPNHQHFALFQNPQSPNTYYIGFEATRGATWQEGNGDYNDVIFELQTTQSSPPKHFFSLFAPSDGEGSQDPPAVTPEPGTWSIMGLGLAGLGLLGRRASAIRA